MIAACSSCSASFDVSKKSPGAAFRCPKCKTGTIRVPDEAAEVVEDELEPIDDAPEADARPARATSRAPASRRPAHAQHGHKAHGTHAGHAAHARTRHGHEDDPTPKKQRESKRLWIAVGGIAVILTGAFFAFKPKSPEEQTASIGAGAPKAKGQTPAAGTGANAANGNSGPSSPTATPEPAAQKPPEETFQEKVAKLAPDDAKGRVALAKFAAANDMQPESRLMFREALLLDADDGDARTALGFRKYEGPAAAYKGRWLTDADWKIAASREKLLTGTGELAASTTTGDVFSREAVPLRKSMQSEFPDEKFHYVFADGVMPQPFVVLIEKTGSEDLEKYRAEYADLLRTLKDAFYDRFREQFQLDEIEIPIPVVIFDSEATYKSHRANFKDQNYPDPATGVLGFYQPWTRRLILWRSKRNLRGVLLHEGAHLLIHYAFSKRGFEPSNQTPWFQEGFAEYFGGNKPVKEPDANGNLVTKYVLGQMLPDRYNFLVAMMKANLTPPLFDLVRIDSAQFNAAKASEEPEAQALVSNIYGEGWAFIMFLHYYDNGKYRKAFDNYFEAETKGAGHYGTLEEELGIKGEEGWAELDKTFRKWVIEDLKKL